MMGRLGPAFLIEVDRERCTVCRRCVSECGWNALEYDREGERIRSRDVLCTACLRCVELCPASAIDVVEKPVSFRRSGNWAPRHIIDIIRQAESGRILLAGMGCDLPYENFLDHILLDASQVTNPPIDPLREPMELRTYLGRKPDRVDIITRKGRKPSVKPIRDPVVRIDTPIVFAPMSFGSISLPCHKALAEAARRLGTLMNVGEGGLHRDLYRYSKNLMVQCASGRFGVTADYLNRCAIVEIKIGQGAKPGIGGHLPGGKVTEEIAKTRLIPVGTDALSPAPHHDIYSIEDLRQLILAIKEVTHYSKPVCVKVAAVHHIAAIASGIVKAGADIIHLDGFRGGTGASPVISRDHVGIPVEIAVAVVDDRLRRENVRHLASIIASGGIRSSADVAKLIALGADAVSIGTAALVALGCRVCHACHTGRCSWGIATQDSALTERVDIEEGSARLTNLLRAWSMELQEVMGGMGINAIESLRGNRERLRGLGIDQTTLDILDIKPAGKG